MFQLPASYCNKLDFFLFFRCTTLVKQLKVDPNFWLVLYLFFSRRFAVFISITVSVKNLDTLSHSREWEGECFSHLSSRNKRVSGRDADTVSQTGVIQLLSSQNVCNVIREMRIIKTVQCTVKPRLSLVQSSQELHYIISFIMLLSIALHYIAQLYQLLGVSRDSPWLLWDEGSDMQRTPSNSSWRW